MVFTNHKLQSSSSFNYRGQIAPETNTNNFNNAIDVLLM